MISSDKLLQMLIQKTAKAARPEQDWYAALIEPSEFNGAKPS
jgi:hypothetical protein